MPELDDLLSPDIVTKAGESARRPSLAALAARGVRRRRVRNGSVLVGSAVAVTAIALGAAQLRASPDNPPSPAPQPTLPSSTSTTGLPSPSPSTAGQNDDVARATAVVKASDSKIAALVVAPGSPDHRISEWYTCGGDSGCSGGHYALSVTADGYRHSTVIGLPVTKGYYGIEPAGSSHFVLTLGGRLIGLVDLSGRVQPVQASGRPGPAAPGEVVSTLSKRPVALDPESGAAHPFALPPGSRYVENVSGRLWASGGAARLEWSDDGGAHWHELALPSGAARKTLLPIPSAEQGIQGLIQGSYGANTTFQWGSTLRSSSGSPFTSVPAGAPSGSSLAANGSAILPDGRLLVLMTFWESWQSGNHNQSAGFYVGTDWSHLEPVRMGSPFANLQYTSSPTVLAITTYARVVTIYAATPDQTAVVSSSDGGTAWHPEAAR